MKKTETIGSLRHQAELRQVCGIMLTLGMCAVFQPMTAVVSLISPNGESASTGSPFANLFGLLAEILLGMMAVFIGYSKLVHDWSNKHLTLFSLFWSQTAFIAYIAAMYDIGKAAKTGAAFIPPSYNPSPTDVRFVGAMGILTILVYGITFIGAITYTQFTLYAHISDKSGDRAAAYYRGRGGFYSMLLAIGGLTQLMLGAYVQSNFGGGDLNFGPIGVALYLINFPAIAVFLGVMQFLLGSWGMARSFGGIGVFGHHEYAIAMFVAWSLQIALGVLVQVGYVPGANAADAAPTIACLTVGINLMPAYLDYKAHTLPESISLDFYSSGSETDGAEFDVEA